MQAWFAMSLGAAGRGDQRPMLRNILIQDMGMGIDLRLNGNGRASALPASEKRATADSIVVRCLCPLLAQSRHRLLHCTCPFWSPPCITPSISPDICKVNPFSVMQITAQCRPPTYFENRLFQSGGSHDYPHDHQERSANINSQLVGGMSVGSVGGPCSSRKKRWGPRSTFGLQDNKADR